MCRTELEFQGRRDFADKVSGIDRHIPPWLCLDVNEQCNLNCIYCDTDSGPTKEALLTTEEVNRITDESADIGLSQISLVGGEPMLRPDLFKILQHLAKRNLITHLCLNGYGLDSDTCKRLKECRVTQVQINLDHLDPEQHDRIRGRQGSYRTAREAIDNLLSVGMPTVIATVVIRENYRSIPDICALAENLGVAGYRIWDMIPVGRGKTNYSHAVSPSTYRELLNTMLYLAAEWQIPLIRSGEPLLSAVGNLDMSNMIYMPCPAGKLMFAISAQGEVYPCTMWRRASAGSIRRQSLSEILMSPEYEQLVLARPEAKACVGCSCQTQCKGGCPVRFDENIGKDSKCWVSPQA